MPVLFFILLIFPSVALAESTITCHCFQDRAYDPARPTAADEYFLATIHNDLYAIVSGVSKKEVVRARMSGSDGAALWVSWYLAQASGLEGATLLAEYEGGADWQRLTEKYRLPLDRLAPTVMRSLVRGDSTAQLASTIVDEVVHRHLLASTDELTLLRSAGFDDRQCVAALVAARLGNRPAAQLAAEVRQGRDSWSGLLTRLGITAATAESVVRRLLR